MEDYHTLQPMVRDLVEREVLVTTLADGHTCEEEWHGIVILADKPAAVKLGVIDTILLYPRWLEDKRNYVPEEYPRAGYTYGLQVPLSKGLNIVGWPVGEEINYYKNNSHLGKPRVYLAINDQYDEIQHLRIRSIQQQAYSLTNEVAPTLQRIAKQDIAYASISMLKARNTPLSLFTLAYISSMSDFYAHKMQSLEFGSIKGETTRHQLKLHVAI